MKTVYSDSHELHDGLIELDGDKQQPGSECPARAVNVLQAVIDRKLGDVVEPQAFADDSILRVHDAGYVRFLQSAWDEWVAAGKKGSNARPFAFVGKGMKHADNRSIFARLGRYSFDTDSPIVAGSWQAIRRSADVALTGAALIIDGDAKAFAACRPPGHHATQLYCGGYCYLNNAALAAQSMRDSGMARVAIVDVDYHHGNGTQTIFYDRNDVLTISLHADPADEYPYFLGFADERGQDAGEGFHHNYPLPLGTDWSVYSPALDDALGHVGTFSPDAVVVSLGLDTFVDDPTTYFGVTTNDFIRMGALFGQLNAPVLVVLEGGYAVEHIGENCANFLEGLEGA